MQELRTEGQAGMDASTIVIGGRPRLPNAVLGTLLFIATEVMFFAGLVSAFLVVKARYLAGWPPPGQPRLPVEITAVNTLVLLASGWLMWSAGRQWENQGSQSRAALRRARWAVLLGCVFVSIQGSEWVRLLSFGLTLTSGPYGSFFYLIVGAHALHAMGAIVVLGALLARPRGANDDDTARARFRAARYFWYFVVLVWPVLYVLVYLA